MKNISAFHSEWSTFEQRGDPAYNQKTRVYHSNEGMTLRDYFAGQALTGALGNIENIDKTDYVGLIGSQMLATLSYEIADAMLAEREKGEER